MRHPVRGSPKRFTQACCVEIDGSLLADVSGDEVEAYLLAHNLVNPNERPADAPTNQPCADEMPPAPTTLEFRR